jgi:hypothetical protein
MCTELFETILLFKGKLPKYIWFRHQKADNFKNMNLIISFGYAKLHMLHIVHSLLYMVLPICNSTSLFYQWGPLGILCYIEQGWVRCTVSPSRDCVTLETLAPQLSMALFANTYLAGETSLPTTMNKHKDLIRNFFSALGFLTEGIDWFIEG